jgi:hypothetical protein
VRSPRRVEVWEKTDALPLASGVLLLEAAQKLGERFDTLVVDEAQEEERRTAGTRRPSRSSSAS